MSDLDQLAVLDELDDPQAFAVSPDLVAAAKRRGRRLRRRRRLGVAAAVLPVVLLAAAVGGALYVDRRAGQVRRVDVAAGVLAPVVAGEPFNILVVGTDGPRGQAGVRTDTMMVVHVDQGADRVRVLSIPRDLAFGSTGARLDTLVGAAGPQALVSTIQDRLGIAVSHYVAIDEPGLAALIDHLGGIRVDAPTAMRDANSGLVLAPGCNTLDGAQTVALVRSREIQSRSVDPSSPWRYAVSGDLGREADQQVVAGIIGADLLTLPVDASSLSGLLGVFADHTTVDSGFSLSELLELMRWGHDLSPADLATATLPVMPFVGADGADLLAARSDARDQAAAFLAGTPPPTTDPTVGPEVAPGVAIGPCS